MTLLVLLGLGIVVLGAVLLVQGVQGQQGRLRSLGGTAIVVGVAVAVLSSAFVVVPAGNVGVVFNVFGGVQQRALRPGVHFVVPFVQQVTLLNTREQAINFGDADAINALSQEGLQIVTDATIRFKIAPGEAPLIYETLGVDYEGTLIRPIVRSVIRDAVASYNAAELISTQRTEVQQQIVNELESNLAENNIILENALLRDIRIPELITRAIEEKQAAEQQVQVEANRREQSRIAAERAVIEAEGQRDAAIAEAQGEAQALTLRGEAIRNNPEIIQLEVAQKLAPSLQTIMLPSDGNFLLDVRGLMNPAQAQTAPLPATP